MILIDSDVISDIMSLPDADSMWNTLHALLIYMNTMNPDRSLTDLYPDEYEIVKHVIEINKNNNVHNPN